LPGSRCPVRDDERTAASIPGTAHKTSFERIGKRIIRLAVQGRCRTLNAQFPLVEPASPCVCCYLFEGFVVDTLNDKQPAEKA